MTLNVIVNNVVAVDREVSHGPARTTDNFEKILPFSRDKGHGVIIGTGQALMLDRGISAIRRSSAQDVDGLMKDLQESHAAHSAAVYEQYLQRLEEEVRARYRLVTDEAKRAECIASKFAEEVDRFHAAEHTEDARGRGCLYVVAYDKDQQRTRKFHLPDQRRAQLTEFDLLRIVADGSGGDLAGAYLTTHTSGIDWKKVDISRDFYLIALACAAATANAGVGGFMDIVVIEPEQVKVLDSSRVNAAVRACGKQIAGDISKPKAIEVAAGLYEDKKVNYKALAGELDITVSDLKHSPCRVHQDTARFNAQRKF